MPRTFKHFSVEFQRTVLQSQTVEVAVAPELDPVTQWTVAQQLATKRLKDASWEIVSAEPPGIVNDAKEAAR